MKEFGTTAKKALSLYFYIVTIASLVLSALLAAYVVVCMPTSPFSVDWIPTWYNSFYLASLWINPCLLIAFIVPFLALLLLKKIKFRDYKVPFILFVAGVLFFVLAFGFEIAVIFYFLGDRSGSGF